MKLPTTFKWLEEEIVMWLRFYSVDTIEVTGKLLIYSPESTATKRYY